MGQTPPFHSGLAIWNQASIKVRIWENMSLAKKTLEMGQRRSRILGAVSYGQPTARIPPEVSPHQR
jgi:hypothetical protein